MGGLSALLPLFTATNREGQPALLLLGSIEISDYLDLIVRPADLPAFLPGIARRHRAGPGVEKSRTRLAQLARNITHLAALASRSRKTRLTATVEQTYHAPAIPLKEDFEGYLCSIDKKQRHEIRRKMRRADESGQ